MSNIMMCKDEPIKCCEPACCCKKPSKLDNFRYWWRHEKIYGLKGREPSLIIL